jgi:hypothetical protein
MNTSNNTFKIGLAGISFIAVAWVLAPVTIIFAQEGGSQVNIASNGQVIVRDAVVTKVAGNIITAEAAWGDARIAWTVITTGATRISPAPEAGAPIATRGQRIAFTGQLSFANGRPTVSAAAVKNSDLVQRQIIVVGVAESIDTTAASVRILTDDGSVTIKATGGTFITYEGDGASLRDITPGDTVRAEGTYYTESDMLVAGRIVYSHPEVVAETEGDTGQNPGTETYGILENVIGWFRDTRGVFSVK